MKFFTFLKSASPRKSPAARPVLFLALMLASYFYSNAQVPGMAKLSVLLLLNQNGGSHNTADGVVAVFAPSFSAGIGNEDSYKFTNIDENLALNCGGTLLSIEGRPAITANDTLPLMMWQFRQSTYCLKIDGSNFAPSLSAVISDKYLNQETAVDLAGSTVIAFSITGDSASFARDRFTIVFKPALTLPVVLTDVNASKKDKGVQIVWTAKTQDDVLHFEIERSANGQQFDKAASIAVKGSANMAANYSWYDLNAYNGNNFYRIKAIEKTGAIKYSAIMRVSVNNDINSLVVFPNPVKGNRIGLQLNSIPKGDYTVTLYNNQGQNIYSQPIKHNGIVGSITIQADKQLMPGTYTLQLSNSTMQINKSVLVQ